MRWYRRLLVVTAAVALVAGLTALAGVAMAGDTAGASACAVFPDGSEPVGGRVDAVATTHRVCGRFLACYQADGGPAGPFGLPIDDERPNSLRPERIGDRVQGFRRADMFLTSATGEIRVGGWFTYTPLQQARRTLPTCPPGA